MDSLSSEFISNLMRNFKFSLSPLQISILCTALFCWILSWANSKRNSKQSSTVPVVGMNLPFVGHGFALRKNPVEFLRNCYEKYGKVFIVKIFRVKMLLICDPALKNVFFKSSEHELSLNDVLSRLYFHDAFSDKPELMDHASVLMRHYVGLRYDLFVPKIESEARRLVNRLKSKVKEDPESIVYLNPEMKRFMASTSSHCFTNVQLTDEIFSVFLEFTTLVNQIIASTYLFPKWALRLIYNRRLRKLRNQIMAFYLPEIEKYRADPYKSDSMLLRGAVDYFDEETGLRLTDANVAEMIVTLLFVSTENTALGLVHCLIDLHQHPETWSRLKEDTAKYVKANDFKGLFASELLNACIMETARMKSHIMAVCRKPRSLKSLGGYPIDEDIECIALCESILMTYIPAAESFEDAHEYNPDRFLKENPESFSSSNVITWGAGIHLCPGKLFALSEIKMALGLILNTFQFDMSKGSVSKPDHLSTSAFIEQKMQTKVRIVDEGDDHGPGELHIPE